MDTIDRIKKDLEEAKNRHKKAHTIYLDPDTEKMLHDITTDLDVSKSVVITRLIQYAHKEM